MGQYYKTYLIDRDGAEEAYCSQNAMFLTVHGLEDASHIDDVRHSWDFDDPDSWGALFSGLKLTEHSWLKNDYVNGVVERIWDNPCRVAWVGDYATGEDDFASIDGYSEEVYRKVWPYTEDKGLPELAFPARPSIHVDGYLVNLDKCEYIDLARYQEVASYVPRWSDDGPAWCMHPLPLLTAIGNGRGGGDYHHSHPNADKVGAWAMDRIEYVSADDKPQGMTDKTEDYIFRDE